MSFSVLQTHTRTNSHRITPKNTHRTKQSHSTRGTKDTVFQVATTQTTGLKHSKYILEQRIAFTIQTNIENNTTIIKDKNNLLCLVEQRGTLL